MALHGIIMAGGSGTRFWPYSRRRKPKQLLKIFSNKSMIQETAERLSALIPEENISISTNFELGEMIKQELPKLNYIIEPIPKNTAACIGLSTLYIMEKDPEAIVVVETSDHYIKIREEYVETIKKAIKVAEKNKIVVVAVKPNFPNTGFGYIQLGEEFDPEIINSYNIVAFKEKPDLKTAKEFLADGNFMWNTGMFIFKASVMMEEIKKYMPSLYFCLQKIKESNFDKNVLKETFDTLDNISIDYGVIEKSKNICAIKSEMDWDDLGDFLAIERHFPKDERKNTAISNFIGNATKCIILSQTRTVKANNVTDLIIADTKDATLICSKQDINLIKKAIQKINEADLTDYLNDYVENYTKNIISVDSDECEVNTDGLMVLIGVSDLEITRNDNELIIEGTVQDV